MSQAKRIIPWWARAALLAVAIGAVVIGAWVLLSPAVPPQKSRELRKGMSTVEVMALLGKPDQEIGNADGSSEWLYRSPLKPISLLVGFSQDDHMIRHGYNGLTTGELEGVLYWGAAQVYDQVGASNGAHDMKFKAKCAAMGWESLQIRCNNKVEITRLNEEITAFWHSRGSLIPYFSAWSEASADPTVRNVIVTVSSKSGLEVYLRERGFTAE